MVSDPASRVQSPPSSRCRKRDAPGGRNHAGSRLGAPAEERRTSKRLPCHSCYFQKGSDSRSAETGQPLKGARVSLPGLGVATVTSGSGAFKLDKLPGGRLRLAADYLGFSSDTVVVEVLAAGELCGAVPADSGTRDLGAHRWQRRAAVHRAPSQWDGTPPSHPQHDLGQTARAIRCPISREVEGTVTAAVPTSSFVARWR
ncbi:MAG: carboxypeptidase-like regulatory domain-containing protein [Gemmatimonadota bacterium]